MNTKLISTLRLFSVATFLLSILLMQGCGQKGPLELERPQVVQEEELEETK
jgi:predicted small lipoprotein YifL